jgi:hypothetical protein
VVIEPSSLDVDLPELSQVGLVVTDLEASMEQYAGLLGVSPWSVFRFEPPELADTTYRGERTDQRWRLAIADTGTIEIELIEPIEGDNSYTAHLDEHGPGLHHVACFAFDDPAGVVDQFEAGGVELLQSGVYQGGGFWYLDTREELGTILEVVEPPEGGTEPDSTYDPTA